MNAEEWRLWISTPGEWDAERADDSHEALLLEYEEALTRRQGPSVTRSGQSTPSASPIRSRPDPNLQAHGDKYYNVSSHFVWIGDRTRQLDGAHVEYFRGIANPM